MLNLAASGFSEIGVRAVADTDGFQADRTVPWLSPGVAAARRQGNRRFPSETTGSVAERARRPTEEEGAAAAAAAAVAVVGGRRGQQHGDGACTLARDSDVSSCQLGLAGCYTGTVALC